MSQLHSKRHQHGQGLTEFALILPILMFITLGIVDFGRVMLAYSSMSNSLREAVRQSELYSESGTQPYLDCSTMRALGQRAIFAGNLTTTVNHYKANGNGTLTLFATNCVKIAGGGAVADSDFVTGDILDVVSTGNVKFITPILSNAIPAWQFSFRAQRTIAKELVLGEDRTIEDSTCTSGTVANPQWCIYDAEVNESAGTVTIRVTVSPSTGRQNTINATVDSFNGTATAGSDYTAISGGTRTVQMHQNEADGEVTFTIAIANDTTAEGTETFTVVLSNPSGTSTIARGTATVTINDNDSPNMTIADVTVNESVNGGMATFTVTLSASSATNSTVVYTTSNGTAGSLDYTTTTGTLTITAGQTSGTFNVPINNDTLDEPTETFTVTLSGATNATITDATATGTINDSPADPQPTISIGDVSYTEGDVGSPTFTVSLSTASGRSVTVNYATASGTATSGTDFTSTSGTLTFAAGELQKTINVPVTNDTLDEAAETFTVNLSAPTNASFGDNQATGTINDNDNAPNMSINDPAPLREGAAATTITFTVTLSSASGLPVTVNYATANGTAVAPGDYTTTTGTLTIPAGTTSGSFTVPIINDTTPEVDETFTVTLTGATNILTVTDANGVGTIEDNDSKTVRVNDISVTEGGSAVNATFTLTLSAVHAQPVIVSINTANGTAAAPGDYTAIASGSATIPANQLTATFNVVIPVDTLDEPDETFLVNIGTSTSGILVADAQGQATIVDNDNASGLTINDVTVVESVGTATFTVTLTPASGQTVSVGYSTTAGTAQSGDYTNASSTLTFAPGETTKTFTVPILEDTVDEANETFTVNLGSPTNATLTDAQGVGTITDNDAGPSVSISDTSASESAGTATFTVTLSVASGQAVSVNYATANGTAISTEDYTTTSGTVSFLAGETSKTFTVPIINDTRYEANDTFLVNLTAPTNATLGDSQGQATITNDDALPILIITGPSVSEAAGTAVFTVLVSPASSQTVTVAYATANGTATAGADYTSTSGTLTFAAGETSKTITVTINNDTTAEPNETFVVNLTSPTNATITAGNGTGTGTIQDNDTVVATNVKARSLNGNSSDTGHIRPRPQIVNTGSTAIPYSELTLRYYFTRDTADPLVINCDWATIGCNNLTYTFVQLPVAVAGADYYLQVGFNSGAGNLAAGANSGDMQLRINKSTWNPFTWTNDYSNTTNSSYTDTTTITVYRNGTLVSGAEPS